jgi:hypothetical protein
MNCIQCDATVWRCTRTAHDTVDTYIRQRTCQNCGNKTYTVEVELPPYSVEHHSRDGMPKMTRLRNARKITFSAT